MLSSVEISEKLNMQGILAQIVRFYRKWGGGRFLENINIGLRGPPRAPKFQEFYVISDSVAFGVFCARFLRAHAFLGENSEGG